MSQQSVPTPPLGATAPAPALATVAGSSPARALARLVVGAPVALAGIVLVVTGCLGTWVSVLFAGSDGMHYASGRIILAAVLAAAAALGFGAGARRPAWAPWVAAGIGLACALDAAGQIQELKHRVADSGLAEIHVAWGLWVVIVGAAMLAIDGARHARYPELTTRAAARVEALSARLAALPGSAVVALGAAALIAEGTVACWATLDGSAPVTQPGTHFMAGKLVLAAALLAAGALWRATRPDAGVAGAWLAALAGLGATILAVIGAHVVKGPGGSFRGVGGGAVALGFGLFAAIAGAMVLTLASVVLARRR